MLVLVTTCIVFGLTVAYVVRCSERRTEPPAAQAVCELGPTTPGIDVSYYQESIQWKRVRRDGGVVFAFIRVSDGLTVEDPLFSANWNGAKRAGIMRGAYQHFRPE